MSINVTIKLNIPWINFKNIYFEYFILVELTNELTWVITAKPEKEHKKLIMLIFSGNCKSSLDNILQPLVISILPRNDP